MGSKDQPQPTVVELLSQQAVHEILVQDPLVNADAHFSRLDVFDHITDMFLPVQSGPRPGRSEPDPSLILVPEIVEADAWDPMQCEVASWADVGERPSSSLMGAAAAID
jgi:hypothetical protein